MRKDVVNLLMTASITALVKTTLLYHRSTSALKTTVETKEGTVILGGKAGNPAAKELASKFASDVHGVKKVVNNMIVGELRPRPIKTNGAGSLPISPVVHYQIIL